MNAELSVSDFLAEQRDELSNPNLFQESFDSIDSRLNAMKKRCEENELQMEKCVQELSNVLRTSTSVNAKIDAVIEELNKRYEDVEQALQSVEQQESIVAAKAKECKDTLNQQVLEKEKVSAQEEMISYLYKTELEKLGIKSRVYRTVTKLHWGANADSELCEGYIAHKNDMKPFSLKTSESSRFFIANYLWNLMDQ